MTDYRALLVHVDASPRSTLRLHLARELAARQGAGVTAVYAVTPGVRTTPFALAEGSGAVLAMLDQFDTERRNAARAAFDREAKQGGAKLRWDDVGDEPVIEGIAARALLVDLLVLGQPDRDDPYTAGVPADFVESVLIASGKPALVIPYAGTFATVGKTVLVAWKPTREAAHAVASALPLIRAASVVHVVTPVGATDAPADSFPGLTSYLREHGVVAEIHGHRAATDESGEGVLSLAADVQADLLVMGCYGHSRARELVLGGASRTIMRSMTLPVLMSH